MVPQYAVGVLFVAALPLNGVSTAAEEHRCTGESFLLSRLSCFIDAAKAAGRVDVCLEASEPPVIFNCISKYAEDTGDPSACEAMPETLGPNIVYLRESCVAAVAIAGRSPDLCETLKTRLMRETCILTMVTRGQGDIELCQRIETPEVRRVCQQP